MALVMRTAYGSQPAQYTTIQAVRDAGVSDEVPDEVIEVAIENASAIIDAVIPGGFPDATIATRSFYDVRGSILALSPPFSTVTAVTVDGYELPASSYQVTDQGIVFRGRTTPWVSRFSPGTYGPPGIPGSTVEVTALWGWAELPYAIVRATALLAADVINADSSGSIGGIDVSSLGPAVQSISVEGFSLTLRDASAFGAGSSTRNGAADDLLTAFKNNRVGVM